MAYIARRLKIPHFSAKNKGFTVFISIRDHENLVTELVSVGKLEAGHCSTNLNIHKEVKQMKTDRITKVLLGIIAILLFINLGNSFFSSKSALAVSENQDKGRYQISAWGVKSESAAVHSGYYVLDTATGQVVASKMEVHSR
jgi:hypothetical protein